MRDIIRPERTSSACEDGCEAPGGEWAKISVLLAHEPAASKGEGFENWGKLRASSRQGSRTRVREDARSRTATC